jgi:dimethylargininase
MQFTKAIVRIPCENMIEGLSSANLGKPDFGTALIQHQEYVWALQDCGLAVSILRPRNDYPDSTFVEDIALLTPHLAIITNPGAPSRKGEISSMKLVIHDHYRKIEYIQEPETLEAGDVMMCADHYFIGLSERTNKTGAEHLIRILHANGMSGSVVEIGDMLHLKSGVSYLENNNLLATEHFANHPAFSNFNIILVPENESYAANSLWINGTVLVPEGYPITLERIKKAAYKTVVLDVSEFRKLDGGLSCLSLRF